MFHQFQNQWASVGRGNEENTSRNNTMPNQFETNLGIGPLGLFQQFQPHQYSMFSSNALMDQTSLLRTQQAALPFNSLSLPHQVPFLGQTAAQGGNGTVQQVGRVQRDPFQQESSATVLADLPLEIREEVCVVDKMMESE